ncbi:MAG: alanine racemase [Bdellovibrio sp.]|nr:alanine racemase [Bdellovibrio sp.]
MKLLKSNVQALTVLASNSDILFMVKANGYGHGMVPVTRFTLEECGVRNYGVATLFEGLKLRKAIPEHSFDIYVFSENHLSSQYAEQYSHNALIPVLSSLSELDLFLSEQVFSRVPLVLKFNTGMNRLGLPINEDEFDLIVTKLKNKGRREIFHLMTHFGRSFETLAEPTQITQEQMKSFEEIRQRFLQAGFSIIFTSTSNSGAIERGIGTGLSHVRPGLMLYGPSALSTNSTRPNWKGHCISSLKVQVLRRMSVKKNTPIGYGGTLTPRDGTICVLAIGYGDGFSTKLQNTTLYHLPGQPTFFGRINMDMAQLFYAGSGSSIPNEGDVLEIWGHDASHVLSISQQSGIIPYEIYCALGERIPRKYTL